MSKRRLFAVAYTVAFAFLFIGCDDDDDDSNIPDEGDTETSASAVAVVDTGTGEDTGTRSDTDTGTDTNSGLGPDLDAGPFETYDRSHLADAGMTGTLDYSDPALWACRPDQGERNDCLRNIDATEVLKDGTLQYVRRGEPAENPEFDCFYVYPTVLLYDAPQQTDFTDITIVYGPLLTQAAPFNGICKVYAPLYRQVGLGEGAVPLPGSDAALALQDVRDAFKYYMDNLNHGRNFVLIGHSQGARMLIEMMKEDVDGVTAVQDKLISALLVGMNILVPEGKTVGGTFQHIPTCTSEKMTGCVVGYLTHAKEAPPPATSRFGVTTEEGQEVVCVNPALLSGNTGNFKGSYFNVEASNEVFAPDEPNLPEGITTPFVLYRDIISGECTKTENAHYLAISWTPTADDQRTMPGYRSAYIESIGMGLHIYEYHMLMEDLVTMFQMQAAAMP